MRLARWLIGILLFFTAGTGIWFTSYIFTPSPVEKDTVIYIPLGAGVRQIKAQLADRGLIRDDIRFLALARLSGKARRLRAGEYRIPPHSKPLQILRILEKGEVIRHQLTIPEGMTVRQIAELFAAGNWIDPQRFLELTRNSDFIRKLGLEQEYLEGYLFPDTYSLARGEVTEESLITLMVRRFFDVWKEISADQAPELLRHQIVILSSIVEKETADPSERPLIARVFLNRLDRKMRLQSDPTVIYGIEDFSGNLTRQDLDRESAYNTYFITGLPPGPICNPGRESLMAVLNPADAPYFYFVSKNDGTHHFSTTLKEHNQAVRKYQKKKSAPNGTAASH